MSERQVKHQKKLLKKHLKGEFTDILLRLNEEKFLTKLKFCFVLLKGKNIDRYEIK